MDANAKTGIALGGAALLGGLAGYALRAYTAPAPVAAQTPVLAPTTPNQAPAPTAAPNVPSLIAPVPSYLRAQSAAYASLALALLRAMGVASIAAWQALSPEAKQAAAGALLTYYEKGVIAPNRGFPVTLMTADDVRMFVDTQFPTTSLSLAQLAEPPVTPLPASSTSTATDTTAGTGAGPGTTSTTPLTTSSGSRIDAKFTVNPVDRIRR